MNWFTVQNFALVLQTISELVCPEIDKTRQEIVELNFIISCLERKKEINEKLRLVALEKYAQGFCANFGADDSLDLDPCHNLTDDHQINLENCESKHLDFLSSLRCTQKTIHLKEYHLKTYDQLLLQVNQSRWMSSETLERITDCVSGHQFQQYLATDAYEIHFMSQNFKKVIVARENVADLLKHLEDEWRSVASENNGLLNSCDVTLMCPLFKWKTVLREEYDASLFFSKWGDIDERSFAACYQCQQNISGNCERDPQYIIFRMRDWANAVNHFSENDESCQILYAEHVVDCTLYDYNQMIKEEIQHLIIFKNKFVTSLKKEDARNAFNTFIKLLDVYIDTLENILEIARCNLSVDPKSWTDIELLKNSLILAVHMNNKNICDFFVGLQKYVRNLLSQSVIERISNKNIFRNLYNFVDYMRTLTITISHEPLHTLQSAVSQFRSLEIIYKKFNGTFFRNFDSYFFANEIRSNLEHHYNDKYSYEHGGVVDRRYYADVTADYILLWESFHYQQFRNINAPFDPSLCGWNLVIDLKVATNKNECQSEYERALYDEEAHAYFDWVVTGKSRKFLRPTPKTAKHYTATRKHRRKTQHYVQK